MQKIGLIDYGMGNLYSVQQAFKRLSQPVEVIKNLNQLKVCDALILPGVGAFDPAMVNLERTDLIPHIKNWVINGKPLLGICLGLQLLFESSDEGRSKGLGLIKGHIRRLPKEKDERIPHMGWSYISEINSCPPFKDEVDSKWMYFVHSYAACPLENKNLIATAKFGKSNVTAVVWQNNSVACQFHPEKSGNSGQRLLYSWIKWLKDCNY